MEVRGPLLRLCENPVRRIVMDAMLLHMSVAEEAR